MIWQAMPEYRSKNRNKLRRKGNKQNDLKIQLLKIWTIFVFRSFISYHKIKLWKFAADSDFDLSNSKYNANIIRNIQMSAVENMPTEKRRGFIYEWGDSFSIYPQTYPSVYLFNRSNNHLQLLWQTIFRW